jgi:hypothetical protein
MRIGPRPAHNEDVNPCRVDQWEKNRALTQDGGALRCGQRSLAGRRSAPEIYVAFNGVKVNFR